MTWKLTRHYCLLIILGSSLSFFLSSHAPYRQWTVYRSERLMIVASKSEKEAFPLAEAVAQDLHSTILKAEATRAPSIRHITRLLLSKQIQVAVITTQQAQLMFEGKGESAIEGPVPHRIAAFLNEPYVLVTHTEFDKETVHLMLSTLFDKPGSKTLSSQHKTPMTVMKHSSKVGVPLHPGAQEFFLSSKSHSSSP